MVVVGRAAPRVVTGVGAVVVVSAEVAVEVEVVGPGAAVDAFWPQAASRSISASGTTSLKHLPGGEMRSSVLVSFICHPLSGRLTGACVNSFRGLRIPED